MNSLNQAIDNLRSAIDDLRIHSNFFYDQGDNETGNKFGDAIPGLQLQLNQMVITRDYLKAYCTRKEVTF